MEPGHETYDKEAIRDRLKFAEVLRKEFGSELRRSGSGLTCRCPFHEERTPSFSIRGGESGDTGHCFGCGWQGDVFKLWMASRGCVFSDAVRQLAAMCGLSPMSGGAVMEWKHRRPPAISEAVKGEGRARSKPSLPGLRQLRPAEIEELANLRGLSVPGIKIAAESYRRVAACHWPQWQDSRTGLWRTAPDAAPSWVITDDSRWCAQFRRLDGEKYLLKRKGEEKGREIKAWTKGGPAWPIGAAEMGDRSRVLLVEGGADLLAAYHFLWGFDLLARVAVVAMLGSSNRMAKEALPFFRGKRVRIMMDVDPPDESHGNKVASWEAAARWQRQLTHAGAAVESFSLADLMTADGRLVKDLNDLALCSGDTLRDEEVTDAFFSWDF